MLFRLESNKVTRLRQTSNTKFQLKPNSEKTSKNAIKYHKESTPTCFTEVGQVFDTENAAFVLTTQFCIRVFIVLENNVPEPKYLCFCIEVYQKSGKGYEQNNISKHQLFRQVLLTAAERE